MPGDKVDYAATVTLDDQSQPVYVFIKKAEIDAIKGADGKYAVSTVTTAGWTATDTYYVVELSSTAKTANVSFTVTLNASEDYSEATKDGGELQYMGKPVILETAITFHAIQKANLATAADAYAALTAA